MAKKKTTKKKTTKKKTTKKKATRRGRPTRYSKAMAKRICDWIASGKSLRSFCESGSKTPGMTTVLRWLREHDKFRLQYAQARDDQADVHFDELVDIADNESATPLIDDEGNIVIKDGKPVMFVTREGINHAKLRIETRKWASMKLRPKKYGTQPDQSNNGSTGGIVEVPGVSTVDDWEKAGKEAMARIEGAHKDV